MQYVETYRDLEVYKLSRKLAADIYELCQKFPREERYALVDQIMRSSRSVGAQIAEAWAKRKYVKHFVSKLTDADGEQQETQHWIEVAHDCNYLSKESAQVLMDQYLILGKMLHSMMNKADYFCRKATV